ncbi:MAG: ATP-binding protein [Veillonellales bacterium]
MFKWKIRTRLITAFLVLILVTLSLIGSYVLWYFHRHNIDSLSANLLTSAQITEQLLEQYMQNPKGKAEIDTIIKELGITTGLRATVIAIDGTVLADSWENPATMENHSSRPEITAALAGESGTAVRYSTTLNENMLYVSVPLRQAGETIGIIRVASTLSKVEAGFTKIRSALLVAIFLTSLLAFFLSLRLARYYTAPLETITATAREIADGNLNERVHIRTGDELELLAHTLNKLAANLDDKIREMAEEAGKMSLILEHMDNAVILLDRYGRVTTANRMARDVFGILPSMLGKHNIHVIGNSLLDRNVHETIEQAKTRLIDLKITIQGTRRVFQVFLAPIAASASDISGVLTVFHDITVLQEIQDRQADFVANASHELATPLTAIKGFTETLLDGALADPEASAKFVNIIHTEAERMHRLVKDLLQLAKLNSQEYRQQITLEPTPLAPLIAAVVQDLSPQSRQKKISLTLESPPDPVVVKANPDWLKQVLVNLIDNGIKYSPEGGRLLLKFWQENNDAVILVKDWGAGIPAKDLPLIFERFYRVDRARTRSTDSAGGTGLGLAIVKFIIDMLGGSISVQSDINSGTAFTIHLPLAATSQK